MKNAFTVSIEDRIAKVLFDMPERKVNLLTPGVLEELDQLLADLQTRSPELDGVIFLSGKDTSFIAGADIGAIEGITRSEEATEFSRQGQRVFDRLENLPFPSVAAVHGACLGGGLEFALACTYRVISDSSRTVLGLPEIQLGIIPGFGGTLRLSKLVGYEQALRAITTGARIYPKRARRIGLADEVVVRQNLMKAALRLISGHRTGRSAPSFRRHLLTPRRLLLDSTALGRKFLFRQARRQVSNAVRGHYPAPLRVLDVMEAGSLQGRNAGLEMEASAVGELAVTEVSKNLIRIFRLKEQFSHHLTEATGHISRLGVIGAGTMGTGITSLSAEKGVWVRLIDTSTKRLGIAQASLKSAVRKKASREILSEIEAEWIPARVAFDTAIRGLGASHLVIEAVPERMDIKQSVLGDVARATRGDTIIVSNTSSLSISELARDIPNPERVAGMHFFNPAEKMPLVEIIRGEKTSNETVAALSGFARKLGKIPVEIRDRPGFLVNRLLMLYLNEAARLLEEGGSVTAIDRALRRFGMPMGAFILLDVIGLDIASHAAENLFHGFGLRLKPSPILSRMIENERLGQKSGVGFYRYDKHGRRFEDHKIASVLSGLVVKPREFEASEIQNRLIDSMINEASRCIEDGIVAGPDTVDVAMVLGAGFPPYTGGLLSYADKQGLDKVVERLNRMAMEVNDRFSPTALLKDLAAQKKGFFDHANLHEEVHA